VKRLELARLLDIDQLGPEMAQQTRLLGDRERAARLGAAARDTIAQKFTADRMVEGTLEKYERILAELRR